MIEDPTSLNKHLGACLKFWRKDCGGEGEGEGGMLIQERALIKARALIWEKYGILIKGVGPSAWGVPLKISSNSLLFTGE